MLNDEIKKETESLVEQARRLHVVINVQENPLKGCPLDSNRTLGLYIQHEILGANSPETSAIEGVWNY